jgi:hypothetical protein
MSPALQEMQRWNDVQEEQLLGFVAELGINASPATNLSPVSP